MVADLTLLYCTANIIPEATAEKIRQNLLLVTKGQYPIVSVSQKPIDFGQNICIGEIGPSKYNEYSQIYRGVQEVKTKYVATVDDDTLYSAEHFYNRPPDDRFLYERNYWFAQIGQDHYWRIADETKKGGMWGCISNTKLLFDDLKIKFDKFPSDPWNPKNGLTPPLMWGEPGYDLFYFKRDQSLLTFAYADKPCVTFVHGDSMGGRQLARFRRRYGDPLPENRCENLEGFGNAKELIDKYWNGI